MKKKLLIALFAMTAALGGAFGLAACGSDSESDCKGDIHCTDGDI